MALVAMETAVVTKSCHGCKAIILFLALGGYSLSKITMSLIPSRWYQWPKFGVLAHGLYRIFFINVEKNKTNKK